MEILLVIRSVFLLTVIMLPLSETAVSDYGENCTYSDECIDHRMQCLPDVNNITRCFCDRFHAWINDSLGCVQIPTTKYMLTMLGFYRDAEDAAEHNFEEESQQIWWAVLAALFVTIILSLSVLIVITFCIISKRSDRKLKLQIANLKEKMNKVDEKTPEKHTTC